jgi:CheY-like chemotaxis protein
MAKILVVEDNPYWKRIYRRDLGDVVGIKNVNIADTFERAIEFAARRRYDAYVLDGEFPRSPGLCIEPLGIELAQEFSKREGGFDKIRIVSGRPSTLDEALSLEINHVYSKILASHSPRYKDFSELKKDLQKDLGI